MTSSPADPASSPADRSDLSDQSDHFAVHTTDLPLPNRRQGKVRDVYCTEGGTRGARVKIHSGDEAAPVLLVATDRISAFDVVMPTPVPSKGRLLTATSLRWFEFVRKLGLVDDHLISDRIEDVPGLDASHWPPLRGRVMLCRAARVVPIECVARGYLAGSGWQEYRKQGTVCGINLPTGLREGDRLPEPIFTPATKADVGHDENIAFADAAERVGEPLMRRLRELTLAIYSRAHDFAERRGILIADTKFEFGHALGVDGAPTDRLLLVDEVLTSDSSRFWPLEAWRPGREQPSFDKQFLRDWLLGEERAGRWNRQPPGPILPPAIVEATRDRYREAFERLWAD